MKNINQGHAVKEVKGEEAPLLKAVLGGRAADAKQGQRSTRDNVALSLVNSFWALTYLDILKALYTTQVSQPSNTAAPEAGAVHGDPAHGETYQMLHLSAQSNLTKWYEK
jgi:hypothetical protein